MDIVYSNFLCLWNADVWYMDCFPRLLIGCSYMNIKSSHDDGMFMMCSVLYDLSEGDRITGIRSQQRQLFNCT